MHHGFSHKRQRMGNPEETISAHQPDQTHFLTLLTKSAFSYLHADTRLNL
jgi:hypothetical protein